MRPGPDLLRKVPLFSPISDALLDEINGLADLERLGPDETLFEPGAGIDALHILLAGYVVTWRERAGRVALTDLVGPIRMLGFPAVMLAMPTLIGARTAAAARVVTVPAAPLRELVRSREELCASFLERALVEVHELTTEICELKLYSSAQRLGSFLLEFAEGAKEKPVRFVLPYEKRFIAAKIGCSQENLSRIFGSLRRFGVQTRGAAVFVDDIEALREFVAPAAATQPERPDTEDPRALASAGSRTMVMGGAPPEWRYAS